ncbi:hypothetical protein EUGRSUZ_H03475 [Eucalyptus grandis]|uniref:Uncharacterized protein n=2 Tax=Eucalyptus grandis TaxID=71139 RepID=A0ACC3JUY2_EUCGR|nr:hypothetical protein EUGRSUZ_H03475 [Eucalyptus grandis]
MILFLFWAQQHFPLRIQMSWGFFKRARDSIPNAEDATTARTTPSTNLLAESRQTQAIKPPVAPDHVKGNCAEIQCTCKK